MRSSNGWRVRRMRRPRIFFITADAGVLWRAETRGVLASIDDENVECPRFPKQFRHPEGQWFGLARRARIIIYNTDMGLPEGLATYEDLADPAYRGMICIRSSSNVYNQSLLASLIAHHGEEAAEDWARGVVANFARKPQGNDTSQIEAVAAGLCRVAIVNSYYVARFVDTENWRESRRVLSQSRRKRRSCEYFRRRSYGACTPSGQRNRTSAVSA